MSLTALDAQPKNAAEAVLQARNPVGLELRILSLNPGFGNVARRQMSALR